MSIIATLRRILNETPGSATNIDYNFQVLEDYVNTALVATDGSNGMTGPLVVGPPVSDSHAATKGYVDGLWFTGMMVEFAGDVLPVVMVDEWAFCVGTTQSTTDPKYAPLFAVIGYRYGGSGGNFQLPDFRGRVLVGKSDLPTDVIFNTSGNKGGQRDSEVFNHAHTVPIHGHTNSVVVGNDAPDHAHGVGGSTGTASANHTHISGGGHTEVMFRDTAFNTNYQIPQGLTGAAPLAVTWGPLAVNGADHTHGLAGVGAGTAGANARHSHPVTVTVNNAAAFATTADGGGTTKTDKNLPPYVVASRIIKL